MTSTSSNTTTITTTPSHEDSGSIRLDRLRAVMAGETHDGRHGLFFGRLPLELFIHVASFLEWTDLVGLSAVCVAWSRAVVGHPGLWERLDMLDFAELESVERARVVAGRARGALRHIEVVANKSGELDLGDMPVVATLRQILHEISVGDGARGVRELTLDLLPFQFEDDLEPPYTCMVLLAQFAQFAAVNLRTLRIESTLRRYPASPFFNAVPSLHHLTLTSHTDEPFADARLPDFLSQNSTLAAVQITTCALRSMVLSGISLCDSHFPSFPYLSSLKLYAVHVPNLYGLLSNCAATLKDLWLRNVTSAPPDRYLPLPPQGGHKDAAPILLLSSLAVLQICGASPLLWEPPTATSPHFSIESPVLKRVSFARQERYDEVRQADEDEDLEMYSAAEDLTVEVLSTLFRASPELVALNVRDTDATPEMLSASLPYASSALTRLELSNVATDELVDRLDVLVPRLSLLIVQGCFVNPDTGNDEPSVSYPALARLASRLVRVAKLDRWLKRFKLRIITDGPAGDAQDDETTCRAKLRALLLAISPCQVLHLTSSLVLNSPPGAPSFSTLKEEIVDLGTSPEIPWKAGAEDPNVERTAGPEGTVEAAKGAMHKWLRRKEEEQAVKWCAECAGVELVCGVREEDEV